MAEQQWISVDERLPDLLEHGIYSEDVMAAIVDGNQDRWRVFARLQVEEINEPTYWRIEDDNFYRPIKVTHWMPLPSLPEQEPDHG